MPLNKKTGKKVPYTKKNIAKAKAGKGGLTMKKTVRKSTTKRMSGY